MTPHRLAAQIRLTLSTAWVLAAGVLAGAASGQLRARMGPRDRGAVTLEQAIITAVLSGAAIAAGVVIVNAILNHSNNIR
ncbi:MAG: hypothetical protein WCG47_30380 [Dermatophilaceae bacterium]